MNEVTEKTIDLSIPNLALSNKRLRYQDNDRFFSVLVQNISSMEIKYIAKDNWIYIGMLFLLGGIIGLFASIEIGVAILLFSLAPFLSYFRSRKYVFIINSKGSNALEIVVKDVAAPEIVKTIGIIERQIINEK